MKIMQLVEDPVIDKRLGRHVRHDPRSWLHPAPMAAQIVSVRHSRVVPIFNQGAVGSCTGNAGVGCISTKPFSHHGDEAEAVDVYSAATRVDAIQGVYPPTDTGSSGLAVAKVLKARGLISGYTHAFSLDQTLRALVLAPGFTGIAWRSGLDAPRPDGVARYVGSIRGGHEICLVGIDADLRLVWFANSWGPSWGHQGYFAMSFFDYSTALADHGDAIFPL